MKVKTITDKINKLMQPSTDSEEDSDDQDKNTAPRVADFEEDEYELPDSRSTDFRKRNVKLLSEQSSRYAGHLTSRKELRSDDESHENQSANQEDDDGQELDSDDSEEQLDSENDGQQEVDSEDDEQDWKSKQKQVDSEDDEQDFDSEANDNSEDSLGEEEGDEEEGDSEGMSSESGDESKNEFEEKTKILAEENRRAEIRKGTCVQNQIRIWEKLLEFRIKEQKILNKCNQLPSPNDSTKPEIFQSDEAKETAENTCRLLKSLLDLKRTLTVQYTDLRSNLKRTAYESSILGDYEGGEPPLKCIANHLDEQHKAIRSYRNSVLLKWDDRTKLSTPGAGIKRKLQEEFDVIKKIDNALLNKNILVQKSRFIQSQEQNGQNEKEEENENGDDSVEDRKTQQAGSPNIYDDTDFYHQQLRELIEYKSNSSASVAEVTRQYAELQKLRKKMKKDVDTRASKGRKIRYTVHNKLINFMAPDDSATGDWTDEAKDELYKSLFAT